MDYRIRKKAASIDEDMRNLTIDHTVKVAEEFDELSKEFGVTSMNQHNIIIRNNGTQIAFMDFIDITNVPFEILMETTNPDEDIIEKALYVNNVFVNPEYRQYGLGYKLYEEFGKIYNEQFNGWPVARYFINPIAEYSFRKAVANGLINENALTEQYIGRSYKENNNDPKNNDKKKLWNDLRQKLPEQYRGSETKNSKRKVLSIDRSSIDLRNLQIEYSDDGFSNYITARTAEGDKVGEIDFMVLGSGDKQRIEINTTKVKEEYRAAGIGQLLYKKFGEVYSQYFMGMRVDRFFVNPVAEYAFRKAVGLGWVPQEALQENNIGRSYFGDDRDLAKDLRQKLPDHVKDPEVWSKMKRLIKRTSAVQYVVDSYFKDENNDGKPDSKENDIDWDQIEIDVQDTPREENTQGGDNVVDHEIYCDYYGQQIGYMHFSEFHSVNAKDVHPSLPNKHYDELLYVNNVLVNSDYRGYGIGKKLYEKFGEIYKQKFKDWPVAQVFVNPVAEYVFKEEVDNGNIPESAYDNELIARQYDEHEKQIAKDLFDWLPAKEQKKFKENIKDLRKNKGDDDNE